MTNSSRPEPEDTHILDQDPDSVRPVVAENANLVSQVVDRNRNGLAARLLPNQHDRVARKHELEQLRTGFEYRRRALEMAVETKLQAVEEMCNHALVTGKSEIRRKRQEFFAEQKLQLQLSMNQYAERFAQDMEQRFAALDRLRNEVLRQREEQRLLKAVEQFEGMLDQLGSEFLDIIQEGVSH